MNKPKIVKNVVCGILKYNDLFFVARRLSGIWMGYWEFPGGKVEPNETDEVALSRELLEEIGFPIEGDKFKFFMSTSHLNLGILIELSSYLIELDSLPTPFTLNDHSESLWATAEQIKNLTLVPADLPILDKLIEAFAL